MLRTAAYVITLLTLTCGLASAAEPLSATDFASVDARLAALEKRVADLEGQSKPAAVKAAKVDCSNCDACASGCFCSAGPGGCAGGKCPVVAGTIRTDSGTLIKMGADGKYREVPGSKSIAPKSKYADCPECEVAERAYQDKQAAKVGFVGVGRSPIGHTHTCKNGHTWDHSVTSGHSCPVCGVEQWIQDTRPRPVTAVSSSSGCASGNCPTAVAASPFTSGVKYTIGSSSGSGCATGNCPTARRR